MRQLLTLIQIVLPLMAAAQTTSIEAVVVDAQTRQPLPFASIFVSRTNSTITNAVGTFHLACSPTDVLRTPIEEDVFQLFESKQLFGVFK